MVVTIGLVARPPATVIAYLLPYLPLDVSWGGCHGVGGACKPKLTEEIEVAQDGVGIEVESRRFYATDR
jgi:hypothetical protein